MTAGERGSEEERELKRSARLMAYYEGAPEEAVTLCEQRRGASAGVVDVLTPFQRAAGEILGPGRGKRLVVVASPGSGKTCAMLQVAMQYVDKRCEVADVDEEEPGMQGFYNIFVIGDANVKSNFEKEVARCPVLYTGEQEALHGRLLRELNRRRPSSSSSREEVEGDDEAFGGGHRRAMSLLPALRREALRRKASGKRKRRRAAGEDAWCALRSECTGTGLPGSPYCPRGDAAMRSCWFVFTLEELGNMIKTFDAQSVVSFDKYSPHQVLNPNSPRNVFLIDEVHLLVDTLREGAQSPWKGSVLTVANWLRGLNPEDASSPVVAGFTATMSDPICMATLFKGRSSDAVVDGALRVDPKAFLDPASGFVEEMAEIAVVAPDGTTETMTARELEEAVQSRECLGRRPRREKERGGKDGMAPRRLGGRNDRDEAESPGDRRGIFEDDSDDGALRSLSYVLRSRASRDETADGLDGFVCPLRSAGRPLRLSVENEEKMAQLRRLLSGLFFVVDASGDPRLYPQESAYRRLVRRDPRYAESVERPPGRSLSWRHLSNSFNPEVMAAIVDVMLERVRVRRPEGEELPRRAWEMPRNLRMLLEVICPKFRAIAADLRRGRLSAHSERIDNEYQPPLEDVELNGRTAIYLGAGSLKDVSSTQFSLALGLYLCAVGDWEPAFLWDVNDRAKYYGSSKEELRPGTEAQRRRPAVYILANASAGRAGGTLEEIRTMQRPSFRSGQLKAYNLGGHESVPEPSSRNDVMILDSNQSRTIDLSRTSTIVMTQDLPDVDNEQVAGRVTRSCAFQGQRREHWRTRRVTYLYATQEPEDEDLSCDPYLRAWHCAMGRLSRDLRRLVSRLSIGCSVFREYNEGGMRRPDRCGDPRGERGCFYEAALPR
jgi:hypothetical protein